MKTEEKIAVMQAFVEGKKIQQKFLHEDEWMDIDEPEWSWCDFEYRVKPEYILPKTWKEFCKIHKIKENEAYITVDSNIIEVCGYNHRFYTDDKNILPNKRLAEAMLALSQLLQLREFYNDGWVPDWTKAEDKYCIVVYNGNVVDSTTQRLQSVLTFKNKEIRDEFLNNFGELLETAKYLL